MKPRVIFMGTPVFATAILQQLIDLEQNIVLVVSQPDRLVGRKKELKPTPVKELATKYGIPVFQPEKLKLEVEPIIQAQPDIIITCAYGQMIPKVILECPAIGCFNVHGSLLPRWRGGAPIHRAIMAGDKQTGITLMEMISKMDAGDMIASMVIDIHEHETMSQLHDRLMVVAAQLLEQQWVRLVTKSYVPIKQDESLVTYGYNIQREEEEIDWSQSGEVIERLVRGLNAHPGAYTRLDEQPIKVWEVAFEQRQSSQAAGTIILTKDGIGVHVYDGIVWLGVIQLAGKKAVKVKDILNGKHPFIEGKSLK